MNNNSFWSAQSMLCVACTLVCVITVNASMLNISSANTIGDNSETAVERSLLYSQSLRDHKSYKWGLTKDGFIDASLYPGVDSTGNKDSTVGLQNAINDGIQTGNVTYLPPGTYLVSDTLFGIQPYNESGCAEHIKNYIYKGNTIRKAAVLVGGLSGSRPIIKLTDGSSGFASKARPKSVLRFINNRNTREADKSWQGGTDCHMSAVIRGVIVDLGKYNYGAIGIEFPAAQHSTMEDVKVIAGDGYAGIRGVPSVTVNVGIEVSGGDYGILPEVCCGISMVGVRLKGQKKAAIKAKSFTSIGLTGFEIEIKNATAIILDDGGGPHTSQLVLFDGVIQTSDNMLAIDNTLGNDLYVSNVFVKGTSRLLKSVNKVIYEDAKGWKRIKEYSYTDQRILYKNGLTIESIKLTNGVKHKKIITNIVTDTKPPGDLVSRHLWPSIPSQFGTNVFNVIRDGMAKGDGRTDDTAAIQDAIDRHDFVFLPVGDYLISKTLNLRKNTRLFGVSGAKTRMFAKKWELATFAAMIKTVDDQSAATYLGDILIVLPKGKANSSISALDWKAGGDSWVRHLYVNMQWSDGNYDSLGRKVVKVSGNGGGRFYGLTIHLLSGGNNSNHKDHRLLSIEQSEQPLTFYGSNLEHSKSTQIEIVNSKNVRLIGGMKFESFDALRITESDNVMVSGLAGHSTLMRVIDSENILIPSFVNYLKLRHKVKDDFMFIEQYKGDNYRIEKKYNLGLFTRGKFKHDIF